MGEYRGLDNPTSFAVLVFGLGFLGTGLAYVLYYYVISKLGAVRASALTYVPPVVALFLGALFLGEVIVVWDYVATVLIFAGVILVNKRPKSQI
ncbi:DMT family transporter [Alphaproteobacteria bacterium US3C007]|nr:DMT family transporter [Alphaproteobacteria bacterium US3C007]